MKVTPLYPPPGIFLLITTQVVSVLFSLISEIGLRVNLLINLIFGIRRGASGLAHAPFHCVTGLTLPLVDANTTFFIVDFRLVRGHGEEILAFNIILYEDLLQSVLLPLCF